jgi:hypothetical protein
MTESIMKEDYCLLGCSLVEFCHCFKGTYCLHLQGTSEMKLEATGYIEAGEKETSHE